MAEYYRAKRIVSLSTPRCGNERSRAPSGDRAPEESPEAFAKAVLDMANPGEAKQALPWLLVWLVPRLLRLPYKVEEDPKRLESNITGE
jgi:hypothetical protein